MKHYEINVLDAVSIIVLPIEQETFNAWKSEHPDCLYNVDLLGINYDVVTVNNFTVIALTDEWSDQKIFDYQDHIIPRLNSQYK